MFSSRDLSEMEAAVGLFFLGIAVVVFGLGTLIGWLFF